MQRLAGDGKCFIARHKVWTSKHPSKYRLSFGRAQIKTVTPSCRNSQGSIVICWCSKIVHGIPRHGQKQHSTTRHVNFIYNTSTLCRMLCKRPHAPSGHTSKLLGYFRRVNKTALASRAVRGDVAIWQRRLATCSCNSKYFGSQHVGDFLVLPTKRAASTVRCPVKS